MYSEQPLIELGLIDLSYYAKRKHAVWCMRTIRQVLTYAIDLSIKTQDFKHVAETAKRINEILNYNNMFESCKQLYYAGKKEDKIKIWQRTNEKTL